MKLGIIAVYLLAEDDDKLLDLHLDQIRKHTSAPYTIYAGTNRLLPKFIARLQERPEVRICSLDSTDQRNAAENAFYLEQLVKIAINDGATHLVTMHPDSFPIRDGWVEELDHRAAGTGLGALDSGPYTACLFFTRDFYLDHHPHFLLSHAEYSSTMYREFSKHHEHLLHSGIGYLFRAFSDGLAWHSFAESNRSDAFGVVYDGLIFHLHGTARLGAISHTGAPSRPKAAQALHKMRRWVRKFIPRRARRVLWENFGDSLSRLDGRAMQGAKQRLLENPDAYLKRIQAGDK